MLPTHNEPGRKLSPDELDHLQRDTSESLKRIREWLANNDPPAKAAANTDKKVDS